MKDIHVVFSLIALLLLPAIAYSLPIIDGIQHAPLHPANNTAVTFRLQASSLVGISRVVLTLREFTCTRDRDGNRITQPRNNSPEQNVQTWTYATPQRRIAEIAQFNRGFPAHTLVRYTLQVEDVSGATTKTISMQAGDSPYGDEEILLYTEAEGTPENVFQVCFIRDEDDFGNDLRGFIDSLNTTIYRGYLRSNMVQDHSDRWAFYYTPSSTKVKLPYPQTRTIPISVRNRNHLDVFALIHRDTSFRDRAGGKTFSSESFHIGTVVHETAHVLFNLNDEYTSDNGSTGGCNVFRKEADCRTQNQGNACRQFTVGSKPAYTPEQETPTMCIMRRDGDRILPTFREHCLGCITSVYNQMDQSSLIAKSILPADAIHTDTFSLFQSRKVFTLELSVRQDQWRATIVGTRFGKPSRNIGQTASLNVSATDAAGKVLYTWVVDDPRIEILHPNTEVVKTFYQVRGSMQLSMPYDKAIAFIQVQATKNDEKQKAYTFDVRKKILKL